MADNQEQKTNRSKLEERLRTRYPEREYADDEALYGQINDDYDDYDKARGESQRLTDLFSKDPRAARFITDMAAGKNPWEAMVEQIGIDGITDIFQNPEYKDKLAEAQKKYLDNLAAEENAEKEFKSNLNASIEQLMAYQQERGYSDEQIDEAVEVLMQMGADALMGKFTPENVELAMKASSYDADVENASEEGEVRGRNARITERLKKQQENDNVPNLTGANNSPARQQPQSMFDLADTAR